MVSKMQMTNSLQLYEAWSGTASDEANLLRCAKSGSLEAFNAIVLNYQDMLFNTARHLLCQEALAEDATQEALIAAYQHIHAFNGEYLKSWLMRILLNKCYDHLRRVQRTNELSLDESLMEDGEELTLYDRLQDDAPALDTRLETWELQQCVLKCLQTLPHAYRAILILIDMEEMSYSQAASLLNIPLGTVRSRLSRARCGLRSALLAAKPAR